MQFGSSWKRYLLLPAALGALLASLFALAVVSFADCAGPGCAQERVLGVAGHALAGALSGLLLGGIVFLLLRLIADLRG